MPPRSNFTKICLVGAELIPKGRHVDRRDKAIGAVHVYANMHTKWRNHVPVQCWAELDSSKIKKEN